MRLGNYRWTMCRLCHEKYVYIHGKGSFHICAKEKKRMTFKESIMRYLVRI
jgi:hypothetical protein